MKLKRFVAALCMLILTGILFAGYGFAQDASAKKTLARESSYFVKTLPITRIYPHSKGFKVLFIRSDLNIGSFYVPMNWFRGSGAANQAQIMYGIDPAYPYCYIFWSEGEFSHIRLYVIKDKNHESWGVLSPTEDLSKFDAETLEIKF